MDFDDTSIEKNELMDELEMLRKRVAEEDERCLHLEKERERDRDRERERDRERDHQCIIRKRIPYEENECFVGTQQEIGEFFYYLR